MTLRLKPFLAVALSVLGAVSTPAAPQDAGWFVGAAGGQSRAKEGCGTIGALGVECDDRGAAWRVFGGYQFNNYIGYEIAYTDLGKVPERNTPGVTTVTFEPTAIETVLFLALPLGEQLSVFFKGGIFRWELDRTITGTGAGTTNASANDVTWGLAGSYKLNRSVALRLDWQRYKDIGDPAVTGKTDFETLMLGVSFKF
jgi:OOP family OmpA-OmpF porin